jgi:FkbM family methyltransferase
MKDYTNQPVHLYGRGNLGRLAMEFFKTLNIEPVSWFERDEKVSNSYPVAVAIVTSPYAPIEQLLHGRGFEEVVPFYDLAQCYTDRHPLNNGWFAGDLSLGDERRVFKVWDRWDDHYSRAHHTQFVAWRRLREEWSFKEAPLIPVEDRYFIPEVRAVLHDHEVFLDCGAYIGAASLKAREVMGASTRIVAIEPMVSNLAQLKSNLSGATIIFDALGRHPGIGLMFGDGLTAKLDLRGRTKVRVRTIDELNEAPTFIKAHLEGGEFDALRGATETLAQHRPILAVGVYHNSDGLWRAAEWMMENLRDYRFLFRLYCYCGCGAVVFAIPKERGE